MNDIKIFSDNNISFFCDRLELGERKFEYIGFGNFFQNILMIFFSFFGIIINLYFFFSSIKKIYSRKSKNANSIEKILCVISITETCISICWLINSFAMKNTQELYNNCNACRVLGDIELFLYVFDWMILSSTLYQINKILTNPVDTLKTEKYIVRYILFCAFFGIINVVMGYFAEVEGESPMLTCFIDVVGWDYEDDEKIIRTIFFVMFFFIPICILLYGIYQVYKIRKLPQFKNNKKNRRFFRSYLLYIFIYIVLALLLISVYIIDYFIHQEVPKGFMKLYITIVTYLSCCTPLIVGFFRLAKAKHIRKLLCNKKKANINIDYSKNNFLNNELIRQSNDNDYNYNFAEFEQNIICKEFKKIFIGISYILDKSKEFDNEEENEEEEIKEEKNILNLNNNVNDDSNISNDFEIDNYYVINKNEIIKDFDLKINEDLFVLSQEEINIEATEYLPIFFKNIREADNLKVPQLSQFFQPKNVNPDLFQKINDSNYYINSTNKQFILRSVTLEQIEYYKKKLKKGKINEYLENNKDSIINRVYGLYYLKVDNNKHYYIALMENIYESINKELFINKNLKNENGLEIFDLDSPVKNNNDNKAEKQMYVYENELNEKLIKNNEDIESLNRSVRKSFIRKESIFALTSGDKKKIKIYLDEIEYLRLKKILEKDISFLRSVGTTRPQFLVVEKSVDSFIYNNLSKKIIDIQNNKDNDESNNIQGVKKYIFKSNKENLIYCISITGYFNNYFE